MIFKIHIGKEARHSGILACVDWVKNDEVYTIRFEIYQNILWYVSRRLFEHFCFFSSSLSATNNNCSNGMQNRERQRRWRNYPKISIQWTCNGCVIHDLPPNPRMLQATLAIKPTIHCKLAAATDAS